MERTPDKDTQQSFEQSLEEMEAIAQKLSEGKLELQQSMQLYERGMQLYAKCEKELEQAEQYIQMLDAQALPKEQEDDKSDAV